MPKKDTPVYVDRWEANRRGSLECELGMDAIDRVRQELFRLSMNSQLRELGLSGEICAMEKRLGEMRQALFMRASDISLDNMYLYHGIGPEGPASAEAPRKRGRPKKKD